MKRWRITIGLLLPLSLVLGSAHAQSRLTGERPDDATSGAPTRRVDLNWTAPAGCPDAAEVEDEIQRLLATSSDRQDIDVHMVVTRGRDGIYALHVELHAPVGGDRFLEHDDCGLVTRAAALVVALAIDADAVAVEDEQSGTAELSSPASAASGDQKADGVPPPRAAPVEPKQPREVEWGASVDDGPTASVEASWLPHVALGAHVEATLAPSAAWGPFVAVGLANRWLSAELLLGAIPGYVVNVPGTDVGATFESLWVEADVCGGMLRRIVNVALCVAGRQYWVRATGRGVDEVLTPTTTLFALAGGPLVALELGSWRVLGVFNAVVPFARPTFVVDNLEDAVFQPPRVGVSGRLALSLTL